MKQKWEDLLEWNALNHQETFSEINSSHAEDFRDSARETFSSRRVTICCLSCANHDSVDQDVPQVWSLSQLMEMFVMMKLLVEIGSIKVVSGFYQDEGEKVKQLSNRQEMLNQRNSPSWHTEKSIKDFCVSVTKSERAKKSAFKTWHNF